jgi:diketogulonate reductase-like aldo/keto reductase
MAYAALGHGMTPRVTEDPVIVSIAQRVRKSPAQVVLAWGVQRGTAVLTTSTNAGFIEQNFDISSLPEDAMTEIRERLTARTRFNAVVKSGVPGFIPHEA